MSPSGAKKICERKLIEKDKDLYEKCPTEEGKKIIDFYHDLMQFQEKETMIKSHGRGIKKQFDKIKKELCQIGTKAKNQYSKPKRFYFQTKIIKKEDYKMKKEIEKFNKENKISVFSFPK